MKVRLTIDIDLEEIQGSYIAILREPSLIKGNLPFSAHPAFKIVDVFPAYLSIGDKLVLKRIPLVEVDMQEVSNEFLLNRVRDLELELLASEERIATVIGKILEEPQQNLLKIEGQRRIANLLKNAGIITEEDGMPKLRAASILHIARSLPLSLDVNDFAQKAMITKAMAQTLINRIEAIVENQLERSRVDEEL